MADRKHPLQSPKLWHKNEKQVVERWVMMVLGASPSCNQGDGVSWTVPCNLAHGTLTFTTAFKEQLLEMLAVVKAERRLEKAQYRPIFGGKIQKPYLIERNVKRVVGP